MLQPPTSFSAVRARPRLPQILESCHPAATLLGVLSTHGCPERCGAAGRDGRAELVATITWLPITGTLSCPGSGVEMKTPPSKCSS